MASDDARRVARLLSQTGRILTRLVFTELWVGLGYCDRARAEKDKARRRMQLRLAKKTYDVATAYMWKVNLNHPDFNRMTAEAERLRFELESNYPA